MNFGWGGNFGGGGMPMRFDEQYHCYSMAYAEKGHHEGGDKILLPQSALDTLVRLNVDYPMLFRLQSSDKGTMTHCGVLEFSAPEGSCYIPYWMMQNLLIEEGSVIHITNVSLPKATFVKLQPQHVDFLEITNPRAVLESALRKFSCVTKGDVIQLPFNNKNYHFELKEVKPQNAACIIETDCNVDFDAPVGYKEPNYDTNGKNSNGHSNSNSAADTQMDDSLSATLKHIPKQSAFADRNNDMNAANGNGESSDEEAAEANKLRIMDGAIVRPQNENGKTGEEVAALLASQTGGTGVQRNSAIPVKAPEIDYWAVNAGDGARLDGKKPTTLKDSKGNEIDVRKVRAEAAARRLRLEETKDGSTSMPSSGKMVNGKVVEDDSLNNSNNKPASDPIAAKRKSRVGKKYSKLKQSGGFSFQGSANTFKK